MSDKKYLENMLVKSLGWLVREADYLIWAVSVGSIFISLYYSDILNLEPCTLCWWQRIFMYPVAVIMSVAIARKDKTAVYYTLPLSALGMVLALYHSLLQWGIIKESVLTCSAQSAVSCADAQVNYFGFATIPFLALVAFTAIFVLSCLRIKTLRPADQ